MTIVLCPHCGHVVMERGPKQPLTARQRELLDFIIAHTERTRVAPSYEEIMRHFGYTALSTVHGLLGELRRRGWISTRHRRKRSIQVIGEDAA